MDLSVIFFLFVALIFFAVFSIWICIIRAIIRQSRQHIREERQNSSSPLISRNARICGKRQSVSGGQYSTSTSYFITFELDDGSREEFSVNGQNYGILVEGDKGKLHSQGTWFKGFDRQF